MGLKNLNLDKKFVISMEQFVLEYFGEEDAKALKFIKTLRHSDLKIQMTIAKCVPFDIVDKHKIYTGEIILVKDSEGHIAPYLNPLRIQMQMIMEQTISKKETNEESSNEVMETAETIEEQTTIVEDNNDYIELSDMTYSKLLKLLESHRNDKLYSIILKEIYNRSEIESHSSLKKDVLNSKTKRKVKDKKMPYTYKKSYR